MSPAPDRVDRNDREVGVVLAVTPTGHLTVRARGNSYPPEGTPLSDRTGKLRGRVARVFGPVERPYLSVRLARPPRPAEAAALVGTQLLRERGTQHGQR
ncbi:MAG TPA: H/ACA RNA-protein complex protein Gar1 [Thermoplasmata archaeon]|nr:H/ACA RNA-protein complex protein Gar1 [Thermoplasmata archaeon]